MSKLIKFLLRILLAMAGFFAAAFTVCFFNLDRKLAAAVEPILRKHYERADGDRRP